MSVFLSPVGGVASQFFDNNGAPLSGGKIYTYVAGTTTPKTTYTSSAGSTPHTNPIILDSAGRVPGGEIWLTNLTTYKFVIKTSTEVLIGTYDNIFTFLDASQITYTPAGTGAITTTVQSKLREVVSIDDFGADPTGIDNSSTAINNSFAQSPIGVVTVPFGNYLTAPITVPKWGKLWGMGSTFTPSSNSAAVVTLATGASFGQTNWQEVRDLNIDGTGKTGVTGILATFATEYIAGTVIDNVRVSNVDEVCFDLSDTQFGRFRNLVATAGSNNSIGYSIHSGDSTGGSNSNEFYGIVAAYQKVGILIDGTGPWGSIANNFYNAQINSNSVGLAMFSAQANFYGGSPENNGGISAPASVTARGLTIPRCSVYLNNSIATLNNFKIEDSNAPIWAKLENNSVLNMRDFTQSGARTGAQIVQADSTSVVNLFGEFQCNGIIQNIAKWPDFYITDATTSNVAFQTGMYGTPLLNIDSSITALYSDVAPTINNSGSTPATLTYVNDAQLGYCAQLVCPAAALTSVNQITIPTPAANSTIVISYLITSSIDVAITSIWYDGASTAAISFNGQDLLLQAGIPTRVVMAKAFYSAGASSTLAIIPTDATGPTLKISNVMVYQGITGQASTTKNVAKMVREGSFNPGVIRDTAANLASLTATVNTKVKFPGKQVWDVTNNRVVFASGRAANDVWKDGVNSTVYTPV